MHSYNKIREPERLVLVSIMITSLLLFLGSAEASSSAKLSPVDDSLFIFCHWFTNPLTIRIALFFSLFGTGAFLIPAYLIIVHFLIKLKYEKYAFMVFTIVVTSLLCGWLLKFIFHRHRPSVPLVHGAGWYSFPSGHALGIFTFSGICLFLLWKMNGSIYRKWLLSILLIILGCTVGLSRIFLHVHYATDVIGSLFFSVFWILSVYITFRMICGAELHKKKTIEPDFNEILRGD